MIRAGDTLHNPVTGERVLFHRTAADTGGEAVVFETFVEPGRIPRAHVHPAQEERFEVLHGSVAFEVGRRGGLAGPGSRVTVPTGVRHRLWNAGGDVAQFVCEIRPALQFESLLETMFGLARDGKTNRRGLPTPLRLAVIANAHFDTIRLAFPPAPLQKLVLSAGAPLGRVLGYGAVYAAVDRAVVA